MDEDEFRRRLELFPLVRSRHYHIDSDPSRQSTSTCRSLQLKEWQDAWELENQPTNLHDPFWEKLKLAAEKKVGAAEANKFCQAFQQVHRKLVYEELSLDAACRFASSLKSAGE